MGYRSDIRLRTTYKGYNVIKEYVENYLSNLIENYNYFDNCDFIDKENNEITLSWNYFKWDNTKNGEKAIYSGLKILEKLDISYHFARIGEDITDVEEKFNHSRKNHNVDSLTLIRMFDDYKLTRRLHYLDYVKEIANHLLENKKINKNKYKFVIDNIFTITQKCLEKGAFDKSKEQEQLIIEDEIKSMIKGVK